jgi:hypothetical protein
MTDTENNKSHITSKTIALAARIPHHLHDRIEAYGLANYPKGEGYDKTTTLIDLITLGLESDGSVQQNVIQSVNHLDVTQSVIQDVKQELLNTDVIQSVKQDILESVMQSVKQDVIQGNKEALKKLETAISELGERLLSIENLFPLDSPPIPLESASLTPITQPNDPIPLIPPQPEETNTDVLNHTDILTFEVEQEGEVKENNVETPLTDSEAVLGALDEGEGESETEVFEGEGISDGKMTKLLVQLGGEPVANSTVYRWRTQHKRPKDGKNKKLLEGFVVHDERWYPKP